MLKASPQCNKLEMLILPLSLENNATTNGTAAIIEEFGKEFGVPCEHAKEYLPFDAKNKLFDIDAGRKHRVSCLIVQTQEGDSGNHSYFK